MCKLTTKLLDLQAVLDKRQAMVMEGAQLKRKLAKDLENGLGEDYYMDMRQHWDLQEDEEKHDVIPEIYLGKNVADFIDPDIMKVGNRSNLPPTDSSFGENILSSGLYLWGWYSCTSYNGLHVYGEALP